ncbi:TPA: hypothetical protein DIC40_01035 [Patescibacteria group bacterium]|nr:hypothetical protein [Candidatus Gracilibacteria bacterium]
MLVERNYFIAAKIDQYGPTIIAEVSWIKFLLFTTSTIMMILVIKKLAITTNEDKPPKPLDKPTTSPYDDIITHLPVEVTQKQ